MSPDLKKNDEVTFELSQRYPNNRPRWIVEKGVLKDTTGCQKWAKGLVDKVTPTFITIKYTIQDYIGTGHFSIPNVRGAGYDSAMWSNDGFVRLLKGFICECGAESVYGPGTIHTDWCPKYEEN